MRKILSSLLVISTLASSVSAYQHAGVEVGIGSDYDFASSLYYKNYNNNDDFVYSAKFDYATLKILDTKINIYGLEVLGGQAIALPIGQYNGSLNLLAGAAYTKNNSKSGNYSTSLNGFGIKGGVNYSVFFNENIMASAEVFLNKDFGDISKFYVTTAVEGLYKFTPNLFVNAKVDYTGSTYSNTNFSIGVGYAF